MDAEEEVSDLTGLDEQLCFVVIDGLRCNVVRFAYELCEYSPLDP